MQIVLGGYRYASGIPKEAQDKLIAFFKKANPKLIVEWADRSIKASIKIGLEKIPVMIVSEMHGDLQLLFVAPNQRYSAGNLKYDVVEEYGNAEQLIQDFEPRDITDSIKAVQVMVKKEEDAKKTFEGLREELQKALGKEYKVTADSGISGLRAYLVWTSFPLPDYWDGDVDRGKYPEFRNDKQLAWIVGEVVMGWDKSTKKHVLNVTWREQKQLADKTHPLRNRTNDLNGKPKTLPMSASAVAKFLQKKLESLELRPR